MDYLKYVNIKQGTNSVRRFQTEIHCPLFSSRSQWQAIRLRPNMTEAGSTTRLTAVLRA